jgi:hypothetical protein
MDTAIIAIITIITAMVLAATVLAAMDRQKLI